MIRSVPRRSLLIDVAIGVVMLLMLTPLGMFPPLEPFGILLLWSSALLLCSGVAVMRLSPAISLGLAWAGAAVHMASGSPPVPVDLVILVVLFATAAWGSERVFWLGLGSAVTGALIAVGYLLVFASGTYGYGLPLDILALLVTVALLVLGLAWVAGLLWRTVLRARGIRREQQLAETVAAEEQERVRIARDMHDIVAHSLAVVIAQADGARYAAASDPAAAQEALVTISQAARAALSDVRMLLTQLRHRQSDGPQPTLADLDDLFDHVRQAGVTPRVRVDPAPATEPPAAIQLAVYRILQEALTNALRHGDGEVEVTLAWHPDRVELAVDNPVSAGADATSAGHGLIGMRERAQLVGGVLETENLHGVFAVRATLPLKEGA